MQRLIAILRDWMSRRRAAESPVEYRVFTRKYDVVTRADRLSDVLGPPSEETRREQEQFRQDVARRVQSWRAAHDAAFAAAQRAAAAQAEAGMLSDTAVAILVDNSGSMRGETIARAAVVVDAAVRFFAGLGTSVEVLGFTTATWRGGRSRDRWLGLNLPHPPGRLCDLLHIIYWGRDDGRAPPEGWSMAEALRPDGLKENIDGEAVEWAAGRLRSSPARWRLLLVISDGAPVDDSTMAANDGWLLVEHLDDVMDAIYDAGDIVTGEIAFDPEPYVGKQYTGVLHIPPSGPEAAPLLAFLARLLRRCSEETIAGQPAGALPPA